MLSIVTTNLIYYIINFIYSMRILMDILNYLKLKNNMLLGKFY